MECQAEAQRRDLGFVTPGTRREGSSFNGSGPEWEFFPITYDLVEWCGGVHHMSKAWAAKGFLIGPVIEIRLGYDAESQRVFAWLLDMCFARHIITLVWEPPCTTFSIARHPNLRTKEQPEGKNPVDFHTAQGNIMAYVALTLAIAQMVVGHFHIGEQPFSG